MSIIQIEERERKSTQGELCEKKVVEIILSKLSLKCPGIILRFLKEKWTYYLETTINERVNMVSETVRGGQTLR